MSNRSYRWLPLAALIALASAAAVPTAAAAQQSAAGHRTGGRRAIGDYNFGDGGRVRVEVDGARIALFAADGSGSRVLVYLDPSSVARWLPAAESLVSARPGRPVGVDTQTPPLTHMDPSVGGSVVLTREEVPRRRGTQTEFFLTAMGDADHLALLPLSAMEARILIAALGRAADELRGRAP
jgi:hypothetical protein